MGGRIALAAADSTTGDALRGRRAVLRPVADVDPEDDARSRSAAVTAGATPGIPADERARVRRGADRAQRHQDLRRSRARVLRRSAPLVRRVGRGRRVETHDGVFRTVPSGSAARDASSRRWRSFSSAARSARRSRGSSSRSEKAALRATLEHAETRRRESDRVASRAREERAARGDGAARERARRRTGLAGRAEARRVRPADRGRAASATTPNQLESRDLDDLTTQTSTLVTALRNPASRGKWGEMQLRNVVEKAGMLPYCDFSEQQTVALEEARVRPDMTVNLPGERCVFVDAKAPIDAMQAALEAVDDDARQRARQSSTLARCAITSTRSRAAATRRRKGSADYVVMFVAGEAFLGSACTEDPSLIEYALDKGVLVTGPLSLISLLRSFAMGWQALRQEENAKRIATIGKVLYERALKFSEHLVDLRRHLERSVNCLQRRRRLVRNEAAPARPQAQGRSLARRRRPRRNPTDRRRPAHDHRARHRRAVEAPTPLATAVATALRKRRRSVGKAPSPQTMHLWRPTGLRRDLRGPPSRP